MWMAQVVSATGDWLGLLAISILAIRVGVGNEGAALSLVLAARIVPGFFFGPVAGVLVDRWDRKRTMVTCDVGRALVMLALPFVDTLIGLFLASLLLEAFTMLWGPAKEASVPHVVPADQLDGTVEKACDAILHSAPGAVRTQKRLNRSWSDLSIDQAISESMDAFAASYRTSEPADYMAKVLKPRT